MQKQNTSHSHFRFEYLLVCVLIILLVVFVILPQFRTAETPNLTSRCLNQLANLGTSLLMYARDHGTFPKSLKGSDPYFWIPAMKEYLKPGYEVYLHCPTDPDQTVSSSYISDPKLAGMSLKEIKFPERAVVLRERGYFHSGEAQYFFADGTGKLLKRNEVPKDLLFNPVEYEVK